jgi:hypothetical protein
MANNVVIDICDGIQTVLEDHMPYELNAVTLPNIREWFIGFAPAPHTENCPYGWINPGAWTQKTRTAGGSGAHVQRTQPFAISICDADPDEKVLVYRMWDYLEVLTALLEDDDTDINTNVEDIDIVDGGVMETISGQMNSRYFRTAGIIMTVTYKRTYGTVAT